MSSPRLLTLVLAAVCPLVARAGTIYVDDDNCPGPGDGSELNPYCSIQVAIDAASDGDEVIVAPGTYDELVVDFLGKAITLRSSHGPDLTIISDTPVWCVSGEGSDTALDGFTVTGSSGWGMENNGSSPTVANCAFTWHGPGLAGTGGMHNLSSDPIVTNCTFSDNLGSGMENVHSNPTVTDCSFSRNVAGNGAGMDNYDSSPMVVNCTFDHNTAANDGGGMRNRDSSPTVINCTFSGNGAAHGNTLAFNLGSSDLLMTNCILWSGYDSGEIWNNDGSTLTITHTDVQGGWPGTGNIDADPMFVDPDNGDLRLSPGSRCIDVGDSTAVPEGIRRDVEGNPRIVVGSSLIYLGVAPVVDMGAYEYQFDPFDRVLPGVVRPAAAPSHAAHRGSR